MQRSALIFGLISLTAFGALAQSTRCYNRESLRGPWSAVVNYAQGVGVGLIANSFDGAGNLTGTYLVNQPKAGSTTGERSIVIGPQKGTYTLNCDGTGQMTRVVTRPDGSTATQVDDFVVTDGSVQGSRLAASAITVATEQPSVVIPGGVYLTQSLTQLPDVPNRCYTTASLQGSYAFVGSYGNDLATTMGVRNIDGAGNMTGTFVVNQPKTGSTTGERTIVPGTQKGTYTVECDGRGAFTRLITSTDGTITATVTDDFLITRAVMRNGQLVATQFVDAQSVPSAVIPGGVFVTRTFTLLPNAQVGPGLVGAAQ